jgi:hypothetical protein
MAASNQIFLVMDAGSPKATFTTRGELQAYLRRRRDAFANPLVYTFWGNQGPSIMTMTTLAANSGGVPPIVDTLLAQRATVGLKVVDDRRHGQSRSTGCQAAVANKASFVRYCASRH